VPVAEIGSGSSSGNVADQARTQVQQVADQATERLQEAKGKLGDQVKDQVGSRVTELGSQAGSTAHSLRAVGKELRNQGEETPAKLADQIANKVEQAASYLSSSDGERILRDVEDFGRRQPWLVVGAGLAVGFAAARFLKASSGRRYDTMYGWRLPAGQAAGVTGRVPSSTAPGGR
jgi:ElaB/YqjD/DUF883 family membrane-anchored ribosome-binding protein